MTLKKLNGAALTAPLASSVVTSTMGRGINIPQCSLYLSCGVRSRSENPDVRMRLSNPIGVKSHVSGGAIGPTRLVIKP